MAKQWRTPSGDISVATEWRHGKEIGHKITLLQNRKDGSVRHKILEIIKPFGRIDLAWQAAEDWASRFRLHPPEDDDINV